MSLEYIRDYYRVPAKLGGKILYAPDDDGYVQIEGEIIGASDSYLRVQLETDSDPVYLHPTWHIEYLD